MHLRAALPAHDVTRRVVLMAIVSTVVCWACAGSEARRHAPSSEAPLSLEVDDVQPAREAEPELAAQAEQDEPELEAVDDGPRRVTIAASGDALFHIKVVKSARAHGWSRVLQGLREVTREEDITFINLETPLVDDVNPVVTGSPPVLGAPSDAAQALADVGVDIVGGANNHAYDQRGAGLARTIEALTAANVQIAGAGSREVAYAHQLVERDGVRVAFLSYTQRINRGDGGSETVVAWARDRDALNAAVTTARAAADLVVLGIHWSGDYVPAPTALQRRMARELVALGVDVILGTGPHILHEVERLTSERGQAVVAYSLGNLVSNQGSRYRVGRRIWRGGHPALVLPITRDGVLLRVEATLGDELAIVLRGVPLWTENNFWPMHRREESEWDIHVRALDALSDELRADRFPAIRAALGPEVVWDRPTTTAP